MKKGRVRSVLSNFDTLSNGIVGVTISFPDRCLFDDVVDVPKPDALCESCESVDRNDDPTTPDFVRVPVCFKCKRPLIDDDAVVLDEAAHEICYDCTVQMSEAFYDEKASSDGSTGTILSKKGTWGIQSSSDGKSSYVFVKGVPYKTSFEFASMKGLIERIYSFYDDLPEAFDMMTEAFLAEFVLGDREPNPVEPSTTFPVTGMRPFGDGGRKIDAPRNGLFQRSVPFTGDILKDMFFSESLEIPNYPVYPSQVVDILSEDSNGVVHDLVRSVEALKVDTLSIGILTESRMGDHIKDRFEPHVGKWEDYIKDKIGNQFKFDGIKDLSSTTEIEFKGEKDQIILFVMYLDRDDAYHFEVQYRRGDGTKIAGKTIIGSNGPVYGDDPDFSDPDVFLKDVLENKLIGESGPDKGDYVITKARRGTVPFTLKRDGEKDLGYDVGFRELEDAYKYVRQHNTDGSRVFINYIDAGYGDPEGIVDVTNDCMDLSDIATGTIQIPYESMSASRYVPGDKN